MLTLLKNERHFKALHHINSMLLNTFYNALIPMSVIPWSVMYGDALSLLLRSIPLHWRYDEGADSGHRELLRRL